MTGLGLATVARVSIDSAGDDDDEKYTLGSISWIIKNVYSLAQYDSIRILEQGTVLYIRLP